MEMNNCERIKAKKIKAKGIYGLVVMRDEESNK